MARDLERLVAELVGFIACGGDQGCSIGDVLGAIDRRLGDSQPSGPDLRLRPASEHNARAHSTIWGWLTRRPEVSIGKTRQFNNLRLDQVRDLRVERSGDDASDSSPRVYASEQAQWESIAGHPQDFTKVLQLEWQLLQGVATTRSEGILQGDLCRLVQQDKRSVPKRTDSLVKKGYLTKRTTLVRGTKTSKLWLRSLAPALAKDEEAPSSVELSNQAPQQALTNDLEPVPWSNQWTGQSLDFVALTTTIMAIAKQWVVIRLHHLKLKLGVLGKRWHMKVLAKLCRALNTQGAIRYTAATLDGRVYKDCIQYVRDLVPQDLTVLFAAGKHREQPVEPSYDIDKQDSDQEDHLTIQGINASQLVALPLWTPDKPLASFITDIIVFFGSSGATNPELISLSLGPSFGRFIASLTSSFATGGAQPNRLEHLRIASEHKREGKVASYRYFILPPDGNSSSTPQDSGVDAANLDTSGLKHQHPYGFSPELIKGLGSGSLNTFAGARQVKLQPARPNNQDGKITSTGERDTRDSISDATRLETSPGPDPQNEASSARIKAELPLNTTRQKAVARTESSNAISHSGATSPGITDNAGSRQRPSLAHPDQAASPTTKDKADSGADQIPTDEGPAQGSINLLQDDITGDVVAQHASSEAKHTEPIAGLQNVFNQDDSANEQIQPSERSARGGTRGRGRGRGRRGKVVTARAKAGAKPWVCEKCGGSWKNDIGLKYHKEKARTSCNPSYDPTAETPRRGKKPKHATIVVDNVSEGQPGTPWQDGDGSPRQLRKRRETRTVFPISDGEEGLSSDGEGESFTPHRRPEENLRSESASRRRPEKGVKNTLPARKPVFAQKRASGGGALLSPTQMTSRHITSTRSDTAQTQISQTQAELPVLSTISPEEAIGQESQDQHGVSNPSQHTTTAAADLLEPATSKEVVTIPADTASPQKLSRAELVKQVSTIVEGCFSNNEVVLPGGDVIIRIIQSIWSCEHGYGRELTQKECQSALRQLFKRKVVAEHWHAFRNRFGSFSKCQIITRPEVDPFSEPCLEIVEEMKAAHPRPYFPERYAFAAEPPGPRPGRRNLPSELAVLDAPVYAAEVAVKRALKAEEGKTHRPRKRRRWDSVGGAATYDREASPDWVANVNSLQWVPEDHQGQYLAGGYANIMAQPSSGFELDDLRFLEPNTYLDQEPEMRDDRVVSRAEHGGEQSATPDAYPVGFTIVESTLAIQGPLGRWPELDAQDFEDDSLSFTMSGWIPDPAWHLWASRAKQMSKPPKRSAMKGSSSEDAHYQRFCQHLKKVKRLEISRTDDFVLSATRSAGPNNIFVNFQSPSPYPINSQYQLRWIEPAEEDEELTASVDNQSESSDLSEDELQVDPRLKVAYEGVSNSRLASYANLIGVKRVMLTTRSLTEAPLDLETDVMDEDFTEQSDDPDELLAAFIAVRSLLGGVDKSIDWGILTKLFPALGLEGLQAFWQSFSHDHARYISSLTHDFQTKFIEAYEKDQLPVLDFEDPAAYDWSALISWTMDLAHDSGSDIPADTDAFKSKFEMEDNADKVPDWRNDFFHPQSSLFSRFEWAVSEPGAVTAAKLKEDISDVIPMTDLFIVRSWVRSLCCSPEGLFSAQEIKDKFLSVSTDGADKANALLAEAIRQLTEERAIRRNPKPPLGGRPYQLSESFNVTLDKLAHREKFLQAQACKARMDIAFRRGDAFRISYSLDDGSVMAVTSLNASKRVILQPVELPDIPFGFEPGNYESRKYPKRYYHFELEVVPTDDYLFDEDIDVLHEISQTEPAVGSAMGELPQWINFAGDIDQERWSNILAAFCFALATRGPMTIAAMCDALDPVLEPCEAVAIMRWGKETGVLKSLVSGVGTTVGEWWWLAVPHILRQDPRKPSARTADDDGQ